MRFLSCLGGFLLFLVYYMFLSWKYVEFYQMLFCINWDDVVIIFPLHSVNVVYHIYAYLELYLHPAINSTWLWFLNLLMCYWIWFASILMMTFMSVSSGVLVCNSLAMSLSDFGIRVILVSWVWKCFLLFNILKVWDELRLIL